MSLAETLLLGAISGFTILLGLPVGRIKNVDARMRVALAMFSVGILAFIFVDVSSHGEQILQAAMTRYKHHQAGVGRLVGLFALLAVAFTAGTAGIAALERRLRAGLQGRPPIAGGSAAVTEDPSSPAAHPGPDDVRARALRTGMSIATAIGLHNFAEGLAIGVSAKSGQIGLATVLIIGFALHNATEGFGIVGPLGGVRPAWAWLGLVGLIAGGPTLVGTFVGYQVHSDALQLTFYALAGGAVLYVIGEIWTSMRRYGERTLGLMLLACGFLAGVATDLVVTYGGG